MALKNGSPPLKLQCTGIHAYTSGGSKSFYSWFMCRGGRGGHVCHPSFRSSTVKVGVKCIRKMTKCLAYGNHKLSSLGINSWVQFVSTSPVCKWTVVLLWADMATAHPACCSAMVCVTQTLRGLGWGTQLGSQWFHLHHSFTFDSFPSVFSKIWNRIFTRHVISPSIW